MITSSSGRTRPGSSSSRATRSKTSKTWCSGTRHSMSSRSERVEPLNWSTEPTLGGSHAPWKFRGERSGVVDDMRVVIFGATGNIGSSLVSALAVEPSVTGITGVARRVPIGRDEKVTWLSADVTQDDLNPVVAGADAVIHLAWSIQP